MEQPPSRIPTHELVRLECSLFCSLLGMLDCDNYTERVMLLGRLCSLPSWDDQFTKRFVENRLDDFKEIAMRNGFPEPWQMDNSLLNIAFSSRTSFFYLHIFDFYLCNIYFRFLLERIRWSYFTTGKWISSSRNFCILWNFGYPFVCRTSLSKQANTDQQFYFWFAMPYHVSHVMPLVPRLW